MIKEKENLIIKGQPYKLYYDDITKLTTLEDAIGNKVIGLVRPKELIALYEAVRKLPIDGIIMEVGSCKGLSTCVMALACKGTRRKIYTLDTFPIKNIYEFSQAIKLFKINQYIIIHAINSKLVMPGFPPERIDLLFIDGDHSIKGLQNDINKFFPLLKIGGILILHDYGLEGPKSIWDTLISSGKIHSQRKVLSTVFGIKKNDIYQYSNLNEEAIIRKYLYPFDIEKGVCIDIGASNGIASSNTLFLYQEGWSGMAIECDTKKFSYLSSVYQDLPQVILYRGKATPYNINNILSTYCESIDFLSLDIDGYDYFILNALLQKFRPKLICAEINQNIPPPIKFTVDYDPNYFWNRSMFFGQSISQVEFLCKNYKYSLLEVEYTNVFLMPQEISSIKDKTAEEVYNKGFWHRPDKKERCMFHAPMIESINALPNDKKIEYMNNFFSKYQGKFIVSI